MAIRTQRAQRETFYDARERHLRAGRRISAACALAVVVVGLPVSVVVSPPAAALIVLLADVVALAIPFPDLAGLVGGELFGTAGGSLTDGWVVQVRVLDVLAGAFALLAPGVALMVGLWACVRRLLVRSGADALVIAMDARPPGDDLAERRLVNLVAEMALAAGVLPPRVMLVDDDVANAAVVGTSVEDATLVIPRRLLDDLGRGPTGAVVADLLAPVVAGDLHLALHVASVLQAFDVVGAVLAAPTSHRTRHVLWRLVRLAARRHPRPGDDDEARFVADELALLSAGASPIEPARGLLRGLAQLPFLVGALTFRLTRLGPGALVIDPALGALWRRRRLLADATAVQLTRDPGALARALAYLDARATLPPGPWAHLFLVAPAARTPDVTLPTDGAPGPGSSPGRPGARPGGTTPGPGPDGQGTGAAGDGPERSGGWADDGRARAPLGARMRLRGVRWAARGAAGRWAGAPLVETGTAQADLVSFVPPLAERLALLHAMGARPGPDAAAWDAERPDLAAGPDRPPLPFPGAPGGRRAGRLGRLGRGLRAAVAWPLRVATALVVLAGAACLAWFSLVLYALVLSPIVALLHAILR